MNIRSAMLWAVLMAAFLLFSCGGGGKSSNPEHEPDWELGSLTEYAVTGGSGVTVEDSLTGIDFEFPEGGSGTLAIAEIETGPEPDFDGSGFSLEYSGSERILARVPKDGAYCVMLMGYGTSAGSRDNRHEDDWRALAEIESNSNEAVFELIPIASSKSNGSYASITEHEGFKYHWITKIPSGSSDAVKLQAIKNQAIDFIGHYLDSLPASIKTTATNEYNGRLAPTFYADDNYYIGFTRRRLIGNSTTPMIGIMANSMTNTIAHEVGHYMHHVLVGDDTYLTLENSAPDNHGIGDLHYQRQTIVEDIAYFGQYYLLGNVNAADATEPAMMLIGKDPELKDYPSFEGFACCLLARLNSTRPQIRDMEFASDQRDFPVVGASFSDLFGIIAKGAVNVNQLRDHIKEYLKSKGQGDKYPVILERLGWRYIARATIVNEDGEPVTNADVKCVAKVGGTEYFTRTENGYTDENGETSYIEVFPDSSFLRVEYNDQTHDIPIYVDPDGATNVLVELGKVEIQAMDLSRFIGFNISGLVRGKLKAHSTYHPDSEYWIDFDFDTDHGLRGSFSGNTFSAEWDTSMYANPVNCSGTVTITIDPQNKTLVSARTEFVEPASISAKKREYSVSISSIPDAERWDENIIYFRVEGEMACWFIQELNYRTYNDEELDWYELLEFECNEESFIIVTVNAY